MTNPGPQGGVDPLAVGEVPPPATPPAPAYEPSELLAPTPARDDLAAGTPTYDALAQEPALSGAFEPAPESGGGPMTTVRALAAKNPAAFIGGALAVGWVLGRLFSSDDDES
ncbi:MAG: hypothetical protein AVDCRST_MAG41-4312 [uncultured Corynebacteriales bacterium]|uniref:Uncharacterized protein n=1 Tax=uncultured Mycobacteriales bacterium TaxID=581187 RepID=A0A6J4JY15_9ACTN|nr:MAG: hypothetical protein AVDCRST_MAG41-4312 [uncultured Corynebacteriales bacterium]